MHASLRNPWVQQDAVQRMRDLSAVERVGRERWTHPTTLRSHSARGTAAGSRQSRRKFALAGVRVTLPGTVRRHTLPPSAWLFVRIEPMSDATQPSSPLSTDSGGTYLAGPGLLAPSPQAELRGNRSPCHAD